MWCSNDDHIDIFTMQEEEALIKEVGKNRCLYDPQEKDYKNNIKRDAIWARIAEKLNKSSPACKKRWKGTRDNYYKHKRLLKSGTIRKVNRRKNPIFEHLTFLEENPDERSCKVNDIDVNEHMETSMESLGTASDESYLPEHTQMHTRSQKSARKSTLVPKRKFKTSVSQKILVELQKNAKERNSLLCMMRAPPEPKKEDDDIDLFFKGLAVTVKRFPPYLRAEIKAKLFAEVSSFEMRYFQPPATSVADRSLDVHAQSSQETFVGFIHPQI